MYLKVLRNGLRIDITKHNGKVLGGEGVFCISLCVTQLPARSRIFTIRYNSSTHERPEISVVSEYEWNNSARSSSSCTSTNYNTTFAAILLREWICYERVEIQ